jgi:hypothetical protein
MTTNLPCNCPPPSGETLLDELLPPVGAINEALAAVAAAADLPPVGAIREALAAAASAAAVEVTALSALSAPGEPSSTPPIAVGDLEALLAIARAHPGLKITLSY